MSTVLNDRDAILQAAAVRIVNPKNASILLTAVPAMFHLDAAGQAEAAEVTVTARLLGLEGNVTLTVDGAALSSVAGNSAVVRLVDMQGPTAIVRATMMAGGQQFTGACVIGTLRDGASGGSASVIVLTPSQHVFKIGKDGTNSPSSITLTATGQNLSGTPSFTVPVGTATLSAGANSLQKILTFANMATDSVTVQVTQDGVSDRVTIVKLREGADGMPGADAITGLLSNESVTLPASSSGVPSSYAGAMCSMTVYKGAADDSANWAYAFSPASAAARLTYTASGRAMTITGIAADVDTAYVDITATKAGAASITKRFTVAKSRAGASITGARGAGHYYAAGAAWSDSIADAATPGGNVAGDVVTISSGTYVMEKRWTGSEWVDNGVVIPGNLIVPGSILGSAMRAGTLDIRAPDGTIILKATSSLAEQTKVSPNIAARVSSWTSRFGGAGVVTGSGDGRFINGEYVYMPTGADYTGVNSNPLGIKPNQYYTVSFDAYCDGAPRVLSADIYGSGLDTPGIGIQLTNTLTRYKFTEQMPDFASSPNAYLRMFAGSSGSIIIISNVKVELGATETAWSDNVITPGNAASYIMPGAVNNTMIGGDLYSTNWNGIVGPGGAGWLMQRSGVLYAAAVVLRGSICGGAYTSYAWPAAGLGGFYNGPEGALYGNANGDGGYVQISADGAIRTPNFSSIGNNVKVTGEISGSVIRTSVLALESARLLTPWNRLAPFSLFDSGSVYNPRVANATVTLDGFVGPAQGGENTFHAKRFGSFKKDVFLKATMHGDETWENLYIEARYHDASQGWGNLASGSVFCEGRAGISVVIRYTPHDGGWDYIAFRARTTQGKCLSLVFEMQTFNFNESVNAPGSSSGMPTGDSGGGGVGNNPEPWCVDYETTRLPDGRFARDVKINDLMECWDFNLENPGVEYAPANKVAFGEEASTMLVTKTGVQIIQSNSTPMTVRDGRVVLTPGMLGEEVVVKRGDDLVWEPITQTFDMGVRRVVKISLHDRMYFAGMDPKATIATHNLEYKP